MGCFLTSQCTLSALFFSGEALGAIGDPEVLEILKQYSTDPVVEVTHRHPIPTPSRVQKLTSDPVSGCQGDHLAQGCQEGLQSGWTPATAPLGKTELFILFKK